jgi:DUF971 family protein
MTETRATPRKVEPLDRETLRIEWTSGKTYSIPYREIRFQCPCASCVDEHTGKRIITRESVAKDVRVAGAQQVGRYAIQLRFSDGHATGIFHFDSLMKLCQEAGKPLS